jgi:hypothetical protein
MAPPKKLPTVVVDRSTHAAMATYAELHGITLTDLIARMWRLWHDLEQARERGVFPTPLQDSLNEPLETFLDEMQRQSDNLDEEYEGDEQVAPTNKREQAIAAYQAAYPFTPDSDDTPVECPHCHRMTTKAGLVTIAQEVRCTACYTLPNLLP